LGQRADPIKIMILTGFLGAATEAIVESARILVKKADEFALLALLVEPGYADVLIALRTENGRVKHIKHYVTGASAILNLAGRHTRLRVRSS